MHFAYSLSHWLPKTTFAPLHFVFVVHPSIAGNARNLTVCLHILSLYTMSSVENRLHACICTRVSSDNCVDFPVTSLVPVAGGAPVSKTVHEAREKRRKPTRSAGDIFCFVASKSPKQAGICGNDASNEVAFYVFFLIHNFKWSPLLCIELGCCI